MNFDKVFPIPKQVDFIIRRIMDSGGKAYIVGGAVRDLILERPVNDWDVATSFLPDQIESLFSDVRTIPIGKKFGTITVLVDNMPVQVTTFRGEDQYTDFRHPDNIIFLSDIESDLSRRDFTINAIAFNPYIHPSVIDPMNGLADIDNRLIRTVGTASCRFAEDPLRMMRAARFLSQLGFDVETETHNAIKKHASLLLNVSSERIRDEMDKLLLGDFPYKGLSFLVDVGIFELIFTTSIFKAMNIKDFSILKTIDNSPPDIILRLAAVFNFVVIPKCIVDHHIITQIIQEILYRIRYDKQTIVHVSNIVRKVRNITFSCEHSELAYQLKKLVSMVGKDNTFRIIFIKEIEMTSTEKKIPPNIANAAHILREILGRKEPIHLSDLAITGYDLISLGIGKNNPEIIGKLLNLAQEWVLRCPQRNNRNYLLARLQSIIENDNR
mgnify:CR=1 FL=1